MSEPTRMQYPDRSRVRTAAHHAKRRYPGVVGEVLSRELLTWEEFGYRLGTGDMLRLVDELMKPPAIENTNN